MNFVSLNDEDGESRAQSINQDCCASVRIASSSVVHWIRTHKLLIGLHVFWLLSVLVYVLIQYFTRYRPSQTAALVQSHVTSDPNQAWPVIVMCTPPTRFPINISLVECQISSDSGMLTDSCWTHPAIHVQTRQTRMGNDLGVLSCLIWTAASDPNDLILKRTNVLRVNVRIDHNNSESESTLEYYRPACWLSVFPTMADAEANKFVPAPGTNPPYKDRMGMNAAVAPMASHSQVTVQIQQFNQLVGVAQLYSTGLSVSGLIAASTSLSVLPLNPSYIFNASSSSYSYPGTPDYTAAQVVRLTVAWQRNTVLSFDTYFSYTLSDLIGAAMAAISLRVIVEWILAVHDWKEKRRTKKIDDFSRVTPKSDTASNDRVQHERIRTTDELDGNSGNRAPQSSSDLLTFELMHASKPSS